MQWTKMQRLSARPQRFTDDLRERVFSDHHIQNGLLAELALYFLIYTVCAARGVCGRGKPGRCAWALRKTYASVLAAMRMIGMGLDA